MVLTTYRPTRWPRRCRTPRRRTNCAHDVRSMVRQRVYALALGYEDLNDHDTLRRDIGLQTAVERDRPLASASTLCRFENRADRATAWCISCAIVVGLKSHEVEESYSSHGSDIRPSNRTKAG